MRRICVESHFDEWNVISGSHLQLPDADGWRELDGTTQVAVLSHIYRAAYEPNLSLGLAWGRPYEDGLSLPWGSSFADKQAESHWLDVLYNGMLVERHIRLYVDGARCGLPLPQPEHIDDQATVTNYRITRWTYRFFALVDALEGHTEFQEYVDRVFEIYDPSK